MTWENTGDLGGFLDQGAKFVERLDLGGFIKEIHISYFS